MAGVEPQPRSGFYFSLPRLLLKWSGGDPARTDRNWREANVVGFAVFGISFLFLARLLPGGFAWWIYLLLVAPLAFATFLFWLAALYVTSLIVKMVRAVGLMRGFPDSRAQVLLVALLTTVFASSLLRTESWTRAVGAIWILAVVLNYLAAALLAVTHADHPTS